MHFGVADDDAVAEALLAEGMTTLLARHPELACRPDVSHHAAAWDQRRDLERRFAEILAEDVFGGAEDPAISSLIDPLEEAVRSARPGPWTSRPPWPADVPRLSH